MGNWEVSDSISSATTKLSVCCQCHSHPKPKTQHCTNSWEENLLYLSQNQEKCRGRASLCQQPKSCFSFQQLQKGIDALCKMASLSTSWPCCLRWGVVGKCPLRAGMGRQPSLSLPPCSEMRCKDVSPGTLPRSALGKVQCFTLPTVTVPHFSLPHAQSHQQGRVWLWMHWDLDREDSHITLTNLVAVGLKWIGLGSGSNHLEI